MRKYQPKTIAFTPQLFPPTMLRLEWSLSLISHRDHALWRCDAFVGTGEERVALHMGPTYGPTDTDDLMQYVRQSVWMDTEAGLSYLAEPPQPFPVPSHEGGAPAA